MLLNRLIFIASAAFLLTVHGLFAQESEPLLLDEEPEMKIETRKSDEESESDKALDSNQQPEVDPENVFVAIVNDRVMTKAELNTRVSSRFEQVLKDVQEKQGGIVQVIDPSSEKELEKMGEKEMLEEQREKIEAAMREEENQATERWVNFSLLAEEAQRQGIAVSNSEFEQRLEEAERMNALNDNMVNSALQNLQMSREDYEKYVYDALMIEKLLKRFVDMNYSREYMREAYEKKPEMFYEPAKYRLAIFSIVLDEEAKASGRQQAQLRSKALKVRSRLRSDEDPQAVFEREEFNNPEEGIHGSVPGWFTFRENMLPPIVEHEGREMEVGEVSDVLVNRGRRSGEIVPLSFHVFKILEKKEASGRTFESALPTIEEAMIELARIQLLQRLREANTHKVIISLSGIKPDKIPSREDILKLESQAEPISLKLPQS